LHIVKKENRFFENRSSGILLHPASLPGLWGIGTMGQEAFGFIDKLSEAGVKYWQMLPLTPTGMGNSPYQSWSAFAGNTMFICPRELKKEKLLPEDLNPEELFPVSQSKFIDYNHAHNAVDFFTQLAHRTFLQSNILRDEFLQFREKHHYWLEDFALFAAIRNQLKEIPVQKWPSLLRERDEEALLKKRRELSEQIELEEFSQFLFFRQWFKLKEYANSKGVLLIGDLPIYVSTDSVEVWISHELFEVDAGLNPVFVAGVPPDYFSETGQLWGNPVYNWKKHESNNFQWWQQRLEFALKMFDAVRIDHFRGFSDYWTIPADEKTAEKGQWKNAPGKLLFETIIQKHSHLPVIAEDLGELSDEAVELREHFGFPGMKILQFAFANPEENLFLPHFYDKNCVVYTGTHDNNTSRGWIEEDVLPEEKEFALEYLSCSEEDFSENFLRLGWSSVANTVIVPLQDLFSLDSSARMNTPGTESNNWLWKMNAEQLVNFPVDKLKKLNRLFGRE